MHKPKFHRFCLGIWNCDTESTKEGYISAFMANKFTSRLQTVYPPFKGLKPSKRWLNMRDKADSMVNSIPDKIRYTRQSEIRLFFRALQETADRVEEIYCRMSDLDPTKVDVYWIANFANVGWDFDVIRGIAFDAERPFDCVGQYADMVQFTNGHIKFRDFLRLSGFASVETAGMICTSASKQDGSKVYALKLKDVPERFEDYSDDLKRYMDNDVAIMDEALNIILNRRENLTIETMNDLPMTATGFGRWRYMHNPEIIFENGKPVNVPSMLTFWRWKYARPFILYLMRSYKGGYCGPNPHIQYKLLHNVICMDAVSMYPHKMLFFEMMVANKYSKMVECPYSLDECINVPDPVAQSAFYRIKNIYDYIKTLDEDGLTTVKPDDHSIGLMPWIGTVTLNIYGLRNNGEINMLPFLSEHKIENENPERTVKNFRECNGKILQGEGIVSVMSSVDLMLTVLCYECEIVKLSKWLTLSWRPMLPIQKRDLWEAYKRKMHISAILKRDRFANDDYWRDECGFPPELINALSDEDYEKFARQYKSFCKGDANGKYGMTVEKPIHPKVTVKQEAGLPVFDEESIKDMEKRVCADPIGNTPEYVKASDYCSGASITMWARWQLVMMMFCLYKHGIETYYCDTDSLFVPECDTSSDCFKKFNERLKLMYYSTETGTETVTVDDAEQIGQFEEDKHCKIFRTLGAKNYCYYNGSKIKITVAGLRAKDYEKFLAEKTNEIGVEKTIEKYFRPNTILLPEAVHKLLKDCAKMGYDSNGLWRGPVLTECGFALCDMESRFHSGNAIQAALLQGQSPAYWLGEFFDVLYVTKDGFKNRIRKKSGLIESYETLEDAQPIGKGRV